MLFYLTSGNETIWEDLKKNKFNVTENKKWSYSSYAPIVGENIAWKKLLNWITIIGIKKSVLLLEIS